MRRLLSIFFYWLYHPLARWYDLVAWLVSFGQWTHWTEALLPLLPEGRILEIGFGPGHLQARMNQEGIRVWGLDESRQMVQRAKRQYPEIRIARGLAQAMPFPTRTFEAVVATFPAPFIFSQASVEEIKRVLMPGGRVIAIMAARPLGASISARLIRFLFQITGETPDSSLDIPRLLQPYIQQGFQANLTWHSVKDAELFVLGCATIENCGEK
jgi:ubiquinone/menaquinone biosynthesis C-methylase UbiE